SAPRLSARRPSRSKRSSTVRVNADPKEPVAPVMSRVLPSRFIEPPCAKGGGRRHAQAPRDWHRGRMTAVRGRELSPFGLGTAALVLPYGAPDAEREPPDRASAARVIEAA